MNARVGRWELTQLEPRLPLWRSRSPEAVELMRRVLLLTVPEVAARTLTGGGPDAWASAVYYALARRELEVRERRNLIRLRAGVSGQRPGDLGEALEVLRAALRSPAPEPVVEAVLALLDATQKDDPVVLRRVVSELDVWAFQALRAG